MVIDYDRVTVTLTGGEQVALRRPTYRVADLAYGPMHPDTMLSPRVAPQMIGLGLLEAIPEAAILAHADPSDTDSRNRSRDCAGTRERINNKGAEAQRSGGEDHNRLFFRPALCAFSVLCVSAVRSPVACTASPAMSPASGRSAPRGPQASADGSATPP